MKKRFLGKWFWEKDMKKYALSKEDCQKLNYVKIIDFSDNKYLLYKNEAVVEFSLAVLKYSKKKIYNSKAALLSNFMFIVRVVMYHVILVSLANEPIVSSFVMLTVEMFYLFFLVNILKRLRPFLFV